MLGQQKSEPQLFNYAINLEKRVRANHPLRRVKAAIDLSFFREEAPAVTGRTGVMHRGCWDFLKRVHFFENFVPQIPEKHVRRVPYVSVRS